MTKQELRCIFTIIDLLESSSADFYNEKGVEKVVNTKGLKQQLVKAFDEEANIDFDIDIEESGCPFGNKNKEK